MMGQVFARQISLGELARLCRRLSTALHAGVDLRKVWKREADGRSGAALRNYMRRISRTIDQGDSVEEAFNQTDNFFPPMFRQMMIVGERTGQLPEILRKLAEHYEHQQSLRRAFYTQIAWPVIQLVAAVCVIGLLIFLMGKIAEFTNSQPLDVLGLGLVGTSGALIWFLGAGLTFGGGWLMLHLIRRTLPGTLMLDRTLLAIPGLGGALRTLALSRMAWTLHLTEEVGMDLRESLPLALSTTGNAYYAQQGPRVVEDILNGETITASLAAAGGYPHDFLDALEVGEESGRMSESMALLSRQYHEQAQRAMTTLTTIAAFLVWALVAVLLIIIIFRLYFIAYLGPIYELLP